MLKRGRLRRVSGKRRRQMPTWERIRERCFQKYGFQCLATGVTAPIGCWGPLDPHHVIKRSQKPADWLEESNLIPLCRRHHDWTDRAFSDKGGRLVIQGEPGTYQAVIVHARDKWDVRAQEAMGFSSAVNH